MPVYFYEYAIGKIGVAEENGKVTNLYFVNDKLPQDILIHETSLLREAAKQLDDYLAGKLRWFSLHLEPAGTVFMKQVWKNLCDIPYGETVSYKTIAEKVGKHNAARAVGLASNRNPIPIIIPCHRVIGINGSLKGYRGGLELKRKLIELENIK